MDQGADATEVFPGPVDDEGFSLHVLQRQVVRVLPEARISRPISVIAEQEYMPRGNLLGTEVTLSYSTILIPCIELFLKLLVHEETSASHLNRVTREPNHPLDDIWVTLILLGCWVILSRENHYISPFRCSILPHGFPYEGEPQPIGKLPNEDAVTDKEGGFH